MDPSPSLLDGAFWITSAAILLLLVLSGFFSGSETALTAASRGIALIGNARTAPFLLTAMDNDKLTHKSRALAARALGYLADADSTPWQLRMTRGLHHLAVPTSVLDWESGKGMLDRR